MSSVDVKINKKCKYKNLDAIVKILMKEKGTGFNVSDGDLEYYGKHDEHYIDKKEFGKEVVIDSATVFFTSQGKFSHVVYHLGNGGEFTMDKNQDFSKFFVGFPKLSTKQLRPPNPPKVLKRDKGVPSYDMVFKHDGTLDVGCRSLSSTQVNEVFKFLAKCLEYDLGG